MSVKNVFIRVSIFNAVYFLAGAAVIYMIELPLFLLIPLGVVILLWAQYSYKMNIVALNQESVLKMEGKTGTVIETLDPCGIVKIDNEYWKACAGERVAKGKKVKVTKTDGLTLVVGVRDDKG